MRKFNLREKIASILYGRNSPDEFYNFLTWTVLILLLISIIVSYFNFIAGKIINGVALILFVYAIYRIFSKNTPKRQAENFRFLRIKSKIRNFFSLQKNKIKNRKTSIYIKCPSCKNILKFPRVVGEHSAKCPCCYHKFDINIR